MKKLVKQSALDLEIKGSMGTFCVGDSGSRSSVKVHYIQTHVSLATGGDHQERLLKNLAPVREVFPTKLLDFEQIMQRDIDDSRVSTELIPYLLEASPSGLVKLFPPIIVVVMPTNAEGLPDEYYPRVEEGTEDKDDATWRYIRSGDIGSEVFELRQVVEGDEVWDHDYARLRINTSRSALVIVDGQHRAMGLIALYRNMKGWPDNATGVQPYYKLWSRSIISRYDLSNVKLPVMFCVFPQLDGSQDEQLKVYTACRAIFLALNKNARKVTNSRNYLLDDRDIVSAFLRSVLTSVKANSESTSESTLRLWNIELDADRDRTVLTSPAAITGVMHLFGLIERLMFGTIHPSLNATRQHLSTRSRLDSCLRRIHATDLLPRAVLQEGRRDSLDVKTQDALVQRFDSYYGKLLVRGLSDFAPYAANNFAALLLNEKLSTGATAEFYRSILFEGQGMDRVFRDFNVGLAREMKELPAVRPAELQAMKKEFKDREENLKKEIQELDRLRLDTWLKRIDPALRNSEPVRAALRRAYDESFTTAAFQNALFITFFSTIDDVNERRSKPPAVMAALSEEEVQDAFTEYLKHINEFFSPSSKERLEKLLSVFCGKVTESSGELKVEEWAFTLRSILIPGELKPDEWSKFRAILAELWRPSHAEMKASLRDLRQHMRKQALDRFTERRLKEESAKQGVPVSGLPKEDVATIKQECASMLLRGLEHLGAKVSIPELLRYQAQPEELTDPADASEE